MNKFLSLVIALAVLAVSGLLHGLWAERWVRSDQVEEAAARLAQIPLEIGGWRGQELSEQQEEFAKAGALGGWRRSYALPGGKGPVLVVLMCGSSRAMAVHNPEVCFGRASFEMLEDSMLTTVNNELGESQGQMRTAQFLPLVGADKDLRLLWSWNAGNGWLAPSNARSEFGGQPVLYKLYVAHEFPEARDRLHEDLGVEFLREFLPELKKGLFPASAAME